MKHDVEIVVAFKSISYTVLSITNYLSLLKTIVNNILKHPLAIFLAKSTTELTCVITDSILTTVHLLRPSDLLDG